ncbi:hypothetical protein IJM86_07505 [bacterium]|nr:hypothetical protein [bacterium]
MLDAIKHLLTSNNISLSQKKTTKFDHIAQTDENYPYFQTAFEKKLIGKNTNPNTKISCDTYIVMKGLVEGRTIGTYSDIKTAYRNKAESLNKLNGCEKGKIVTSKTL